jgi:ATP-dependent DNA helicase RecG
MRPDKLFTLFSDVSRLKGVGDHMKKALGRLCHGDEDARVTLRDLVFHLPVSVIDRGHGPDMKDAKDGDVVTLVATVQSHQPPPRGRGRLPYKVICHSQQGFLTLVFFHARSEYLLSALPVGSARTISGKFERRGVGGQITHPDVIAPAEDMGKIQQPEPVYGLTATISNRQLSKIIRAGLALLPDLSEWIDAEFLRLKGWAGWKASLLAAHEPQSLEDLLPQSIPRTRLAYDELLANQLALALVRRGLRKPVARPVAASGALRTKLRGALPFQLTQGQESVLSEIDADMASGHRMLRLMQGDVGSGKTVVALMAMLSAVEAGRQAALMAPTELLALQHFAFIRRMLQPHGVPVELLTGSLKAREHSDALTRIASGEASIVIGTHALFQEKVVFHDLALAVIDEQHRFGVAQRMMLTSKNADTHVLVMTATPIPRTLTMTAFGDMDCSALTEKPIGRQPIATKAVPLSRADDVIEAVARAMEAGTKVYWICPLVEESEDENAPSDLAAAQMRHTEFTHRFAGRVGLVHGRLPAAERDTVMAGFAGDAFDLLVATTVVEVGVDVPAATVIVIEHAERFGLSQLHQLRGRVGRSDKPSTCILLYTDQCNDTAKARLRAIRETNDGFRIAEEDLKLRGSGDILGTRQSGMPDFRFADLTQHYELLRAAYDDARLALQTDGHLLTARGEALKTLLYLFGYDENIRYLEAG